MIHVHCIKIHRKLSITREEKDKISLIQRNDMIFLIFNMKMNIDKDILYMSIFLTIIF